MACAVVRRATLWSKVYHAVSSLQLGSTENNAVRFNWHALNM